MNKAILAAAIICVLLLTGCAVPPSTPPKESASQIARPPWAIFASRVDYPASAMATREQGIALVLIQGDDKHPIPKLISSSGFSDLDNASMSLVVRYFQSGKMRGGRQLGVGWSIPPDVQRGIWLLGKIKIVIVGQILGTSLKGTAYQVEPDPPAPTCSNGHIFRSYFFTEYGPRRHSWFVPSFVRRRVDDQNDQISIGYDTSQGTYCAGMPWAWKNDFLAQIGISNVAKYTCIPKEVVALVFPHTNMRRFPTDIFGVTPGSDWRRYHLTYIGYKDASSVTTAQLDFDPDTGWCLSGVNLMTAPNRNRNDLSSPDSQEKPSSYPRF